MRLSPSLLFASVGFCSLLVLPPAHSDTLDDIRAQGELTWGADAVEGGAPYVFLEDSNREDSYIGFEVDLAAALARELGVKPRLVQNAWDSLVPGLLKGDYHLVLNGLEITEDRAEVVAFSKPYYVASEQLTVRKESLHINALADLKGRKVGTLKASLAERILAGEGGIDVAPYEGLSTAYEDLALARVEAVLMDYPIALYYGKIDPRLRLTGGPISEAQYGIAVRKGDATLLAAVNDALDRLAVKGELRRIYEAWGLWNDATARRLGDTRPGNAPAPRFEAYRASVGAESAAGARWSRYVDALPLLLQAAGTTLWISLTAMTLAILLGVTLAVARLYAPPPVSALAYGYVEVVRGTPLLVQLYLLYYGLPNLGVNLPPNLAGILALGLNYAAYEAENYRAGILSVAGTQREAAVALGLTPPQAFRHVILPQAVRVSLPTVTNDFIALLKDSSIVSVITIIELTNRSRELSGTTFDYLGFGLLTAAIYFLMGLPFAWMARRLEKRMAVYVR